VDSILQRLNPRRSIDDVRVNQHVALFEN